MACDKKQKEQTPKRPRWTVALSNLLTPPVQGLRPCVRHVMRCAINTSAFLASFKQQMLALLALRSSDDQTTARQATRDRLQPPDSFVGHRCVICMSELRLLDRDHNTTSNSQLIDYLGANLASGCREGHLNQTGCVHRGWIGVGTTI